MRRAILEVDAGVMERTVTALCRLGVAIVGSAASDNPDAQVVALIIESNGIPKGATHVRALLATGMRACMHYSELSFERIAPPT